MTETAESMNPVVLQKDHDGQYSGRAVQGQANHNAILPLFSPMVRKPEKKYRTIVADPPWNYDEHMGEGPKGAGAQYPCMTEAELMTIPVGQWAMDDSLLFLWIPNSFLLKGTWRNLVREAWGFEPRQLMTWGKGRIEDRRIIHHIGLGPFLRNSTEQVILCVRGNPAIKNRDVPTLLLAPRARHSEKPAAFYDIVEYVAFGPYLDVFARAQRFNWDTFGDEAFNFGTTLPPAAFVGEQER